MKNINWGGNNERNVESLMMILSSASVAYLSPQSTGSLTIMLWSSQMETCSNNFGTTWSLRWPLMFTFRQSLTFCDWNTCGWYIIQLKRDFFIWSLIFEFPFFFGLNAHGLVPYFIDFCFNLVAPTRQMTVFFFTFTVIFWHLVFWLVLVSWEIWYCCWWILQ